MHDDYEKIYIDNEKLVYKFATTYKLLNDEDMMQNLKMAAYRAIVKFDSSKGTALSTYVYTALFNEYNYSFRDKNLKIQYADNIVTDDMDKQSDIFDFIEDTSIKNVDDELDKKDMIIKIYKYLDEHEPKYKNLFLDYYFNNIKQKQLAEKYKLNLSYVSKKINSITKHLRDLLKDYY